MLQGADATAALEELLRESKVRPHWPMYLRTFKQFLRTLQPSFDERQYGFSSTYELVRQAHKDGLLRVERNRQGILRIYPADRFPRLGQEQPSDESTPVDIIESGQEMSITDISAPGQEPEPVMQSELPEPFLEVQTEIAEPVSEQEPQQEGAAVIEEVVEERAPKPRAKRGRKPSGSKTTRMPRKTRSKASSS